MKITRVSTAVVAGNFPWVLVRIETDEGVTGLGEAYWGVGVAELVHRAGALIIGENPHNIHKLYEMMIRCLSGEGSIAGATVTAISGIELALWDLVGRALNTPIYNLFGGRFRDKIRIYADCHSGADHTPESYAERAREVAAAGFTAIKFDLDNKNPLTLDISDDPTRAAIGSSPLTARSARLSCNGWSTWSRPCGKLSGRRSWWRWIA